MELMEFRAQIRLTTDDMRYLMSAVSFSSASALNSRPNMWLE